MKRIVSILLIGMLFLLSSCSEKQKEAGASVVSSVADTAKNVASTVSNFASDTYHEIINSMYEVETIVKAGGAADQLSSSKLDFIIGEDFYIKLNIYAREVKFYSFHTDITFEVIFPETEVLAVEIAEVRGDQLLSEYVDPVTGNHIFKFVMETIDFDRSARPFDVTFRCRPLADGNHKIKIVYDENISSSYDFYKNFKYVLE